MTTRVKGRPKLFCTLPRDCQGDTFFPEYKALEFPHRIQLPPSTHSSFNTSRVFYLHHTYTANYEYLPQNPHIYIYLVPTRTDKPNLNLDTAIIIHQSPSVPSQNQPTKQTHHNAHPNHRGFSRSRHWCLLPCGSRWCWQLSTSEL